MSTTEISDPIDLNSDFVSIDGAEDESHCGDGSPICDIGLETVVDHSNGPMEDVEGLSNDSGNDWFEGGMDFGDWVSNLELEMEHVDTSPAMDGGDVVACTRSMAIADDDDVAEAGAGDESPELTGNEFNLFVDLNSSMDGEGNSKSGNRAEPLSGGVSEITGNELHPSNLYVDLSSCMDRAKSGNGVYVLLEGVSEITGNKFNPSNLFVDLNSCMDRDGIGRERTKLLDISLGDNADNRDVCKGNPDKTSGLLKHKEEKTGFLGVDSFEPAKIIQSIKMLAIFLHSQVDRLEHTIAQAQVLAFYRSKGLLKDDEESMFSDPQASHVSASNLVDRLGEDSEVELLSPTALILKFSDFDSIPSVTSLKRVYSEFGPLNGTGIKVLKKSSRAKLVFKRRADAEKAFSSPGKYQIFGPSLVSYSLKYLSSSPHPKKKHRKDPMPE